MLSAATDHSNIICLYGREEDEDFIYLVLEPYDCNLYDLIKNKSHPELWSFSNGFPSPDLLVLLRGIIVGLAHLHSLGFVHSDLKPSDVLMVGLRPKLSGSCYHLDHDKSLSRRYDTDISCTLGLSNEEDDEDWWLAVGDTASILSISDTEIEPGMDMIRLASIIYFCLGEGPRRLLRLPVKLSYEAQDLIFILSHSKLESRAPNASEVIIHPLFWNNERCSSFLKDAIDWIERKECDTLFPDINYTSNLVFYGTGWHVRVPRAFKQLKPVQIDVFFRKKFPALLMEADSEATVEAWTVSKSQFMAAMIEN
ncbi:hypothetical protein QVD17_40898 [Tagetes erecta]|uniref:Protein kinase domain-containing protein n=1 Tax=Tagetes erecta TaxID=13708 RepID=A0AAD8JSD3_TARER|nr:hypothetical protein QVD17_40898 [Tagetes erecta]